MSVIVKTTNHFTLHFNESERILIVNIKWQYSWLHHEGASEWSSLEREKYNHELEKLLWRGWNGKYTLKVRGNSSFAVNNKNSSFTVLFDIKRIESLASWTVEVEKISSDQYSKSYLDWSRRKISLDAEDTIVKVRTIHGRYKDHSPYQESNNPYWNFHAEEYKNGNNLIKDPGSILNISNQLRKREMEYLVSFLNDTSNPFIPDTEFYI